MKILLTSSMRKVEKFQVKYKKRIAQIQYRQEQFQQNKYTHPSEANKSLTFVSSEKLSLKFYRIFT